MKEVKPKMADKLVETAATNAYSESEQVCGFFSLIKGNLAVPFKVRVPGQIDDTIRIVSDAFHDIYYR